MARPAPSAERTVAILDFLAAHPEESFTLSELSRRLRLNKATAHALCTTLTTSGYLLRHPSTKAYRLGPALVALGNAAASRQLDLVDQAKDEMRRVASLLDVQCVASAAIGDEIVFLATSGGSGPFDVHIPVGQRLPLVPPLGTVFVAWSSPEVIDGWLLRLGPGATERELDAYRAAVATVRHRGYSIGLEADARRRLGQEVSALEDDTRSPRHREVLEELVAELGHQEYILLDLEGSASYHLSHLAAPVFDATGAVVLALTLVGFRGRLGAKEVAGLAEQLVVAAGKVTVAVGGRAVESGGEGGADGGSDVAT